MPEPWFKTAFGRFYTLIYAHRDVAEAARCLEVFNNLVPLAQAGLLLDLGCGAGRHLEPLRRLGCTVVGLDLSSDLLELARNAGPQNHPRLIRGDMRSLPCATESFAGVLSLFTAFGYFGELPANEPHLAEIARVLAPRGHWYLDYFDARKVRSELAGREFTLRRRELDLVSVVEKRSLTASEGQVLKEVSLLPDPHQAEAASQLGIPAEGVTYKEAVALFDLPELDELAAQHGLLRVAGAGGYDGVPLHGGDRWMLVYRKEGRTQFLEEDA